MNTIQDPHTLPYPPLPKGFARWEPRPQGWKSEGQVTYAFFHPGLSDPKWQVMPGTMQTFGDPKCHYIQAMMSDRCQTCDGTGDVHRADGEYLGRCHCKTEQLHAPGDPEEWMPQDEPAPPASEPEDIRAAAITEEIITVLRDNKANLPAAAFSLIAPIIIKAITP